MKQKGVFSRKSLEKTLGLTTDQAYWYIKRFQRSGVIKKLNKTINVGIIGKKEQALYKVIT